MTRHIFKAAQFLSFFTAAIICECTQWYPPQSFDKPQKHSTVFWCLLLRSLLLYCTEEWYTNGSELLNTTAIMFMMRNQVGNFLLLQKIWCRKLHKSEKEQMLYNLLRGFFKFLCKIVAVA